MTRSGDQLYCTYVLSRPTPLHCIASHRKLSFAALHCTATLSALAREKGTESIPIEEDCTACKTYIINIKEIMPEKGNYYYEKKRKIMLYLKMSTVGGRREIPYKIDQ